MSQQLQKQSIRHILQTSNLGCAISHLLIQEHDSAFQDSWFFSSKISNQTDTIVVAGGRVDVS